MGLSSNYKLQYRKIIQTMSLDQMVKINLAYLIFGTSTWIFPQYVHRHLNIYYLFIEKEIFKLFCRYNGSKPPPPYMTICPSQSFAGRADTVCCLSSSSGFCQTNRWLKILYLISSVNGTFPQISICWSSNLFAN